MTENETTGGVRASDAERERIAQQVSDAAGEGRLTLEEAEQRLARIYETTFRRELDQYVADLPDTRRDAIRDPGGRFPVRLRVHAAIAVVVSVVLIVRWATLDVPFFFPAFPIFFLFGSLLLHARFVAWSGRGPGYGPPWRTERRATAD